MKLKIDVDDNKYKSTQNSRFAQVSKLKLKWKVWGGSSMEAFLVVNLPS